MNRFCRFLALTILATVPSFANSWLGSLSAQEKSSTGIVTFTTQEDHQNMLKQLGITKLRPGPSGNESAPNHANYDESLANPYPDLPELLVCSDGTVVKSKEEWISKRRPETVELLEKEVIGRVPADTPKVTWKVLEEKEIMAGDIPMIEKSLEGIVDNSRCPEIEVKIALRVGVPKNANKEKPVPTLIMFSFFGFGETGRAASACFPICRVHRARKFWQKLVGATRCSVQPVCRRTTAPD